MFHNDIMYSVMQERARDLRARGENAREAGVARRMRRFWTEEAAQRSESRVVKGGHRARGAVSRA